MRLCEQIIQFLRLDIALLYILVHTTHVRNMDTNIFPINFLQESYS